MASLKPFVLNLDDLNFLLKQIKFRPLFDVNGNAIVAWNGVGAIYDGHQNQIWNGVGLTPEAAIQTYGPSYASTTDLSGLRDVTGLNNNLLLVNSDWGSVDQPFVRTIEANYGGYVQAVDPGVVGSYGANNGGFDLSIPQPGVQYTAATNYAPTITGSGPAATVTLQNVVDYTPRMISQTITTGGVAMLTEGDLAGYTGTTPNHIVYNTPFLSDGTTPNPSYDAGGIIGEALVMNDDYGMLQGLGHTDYQKANADGTPDLTQAGSTEVFIGAENPGVAPTNGWFALFGQFFDHGLDFIDKSSDKTIKIALAQDDPLYGVTGSDGRPVTSITITRATPAGVDANGDVNYVNHTSPFIDQSQTYGSNGQITQLLREWVSTDNGLTYHAGMNLFDGHTLATAWIRNDGVSTTQTLPTLSELRDAVLDTNRDALTWEDVLNFRNRDANGDVATAAAAGLSDQALLLDMNPRFDGSRLDSTTSVGSSTVAALVDAAVTVLATATPGLAFSQTVAGGIQLVVTGGAGGPFLPDGTYTGASALAPWVNFANFSITAPAGAVHDAVGQILMAAVGDHYVAGDGRVNENFGLTAIHHVFHEEHNTQIRNIINTISVQDAAGFAANGTHDVLHNWQVTTGTTLGVDGNYRFADGSIAWDSDKMFDAAKLVVEMEYQHAAIDQYARTITPHILEVVGYSSGVDPTVSLEFSQAAFRFGHSTLRETIDTIDPAGGLTGQIVSYALEQAFLNPGLYADTGPAAIALGMSHQQMNEVDEFITPALNQGLLGLPLDLAAINIARGRDVGIPGLNAFREAVGLAKYVSWDDFGRNMIHPTSLVNFIAAYAFDGDVARARALVGLVDGSIVEGSLDALGYTADQALAFMLNDTGAPAGADAFNSIDTWIGGLAEAHVPGGLLGPTFDLVFVNQMENLINGDRFYYLVRLFGQQFGEEVNNGQFKDIVERNTGLEHLNGSIFAYADKYYDFGLDSDANTAGIQGNHAEHGYADLIAAHANDLNGGTVGNPLGLGIWSDGSANPLSLNSNGTLITTGGIQYIRDFRPDLAPDATHPVEGTPTSGAESHEVMVGTAYRDYVHMRSGDDTFYGEGGDDKIFGDFGNDRLYGGDGNDVIDSGDGADLVDGGAGDDTIYGYGSGTEIGGFDQLIGGDGNDIIHGGEGVDKLSGGAGDDQLYGEGNTDPFTHGGDGNDYIDGGSSGDNLYGDAGDDFVYGSDDQDIVQGDSGDDILRPGKPSQAINGGPDEVIGGTGFEDDGFDIMDLSDWDVSPTGTVADLTTQANPLVAIDGTVPFPAWFQIEGVVATQNNDILIGTDAVTAAGDVTLFDGSNWLIGGSGSDTLTGAGGNDVIVGSSIRLDSLIGRYVQTNGTPTLTDDTTASAYNTYDAYAGATHRVAPTDHLSAGLLGNTALGTQMFDLHYTEFLKTAMFKDHVLGQETVAGSGVAAADTGTDTAVFSGNYADYSIAAVTLGAIVAYRIVDNRADSPDGTDLVVGVESLQFADRTISLSNTAPTLDLHAFTAGNYRDQFGGTPAYSNSNGSQSWTATPWAELGDDNNVTSTDGQIHITGSQLRFDDGNGTNDGASIARVVNLAGATSATLSYDFDENSFNSGETVTVQFAADGVNFTQTVQTIDGASGSGSRSVALTGPFTATSTIRFVVSGVSGNNDDVRIDNVNVAFTKPANDGSNDYAATFTENGSAVAIANLPGIADDGSVIHSARIILINAKAGDGFNLNDVGGDGIAGVIVTSVPGQITINLTGVATLAAYQNAIQAIRFSNSSDAPDTSPRTVQVTVNDGLVDSDIATATIAVVPVNDAPNATNDNVITNVTSGSFAVPEWALLANDTDPDSPLSMLDVTAVSESQSNFSVSLAGGSVNVTHSTGDQRTFNYTVSDGQATDTGSVNVSRDTGNVAGGSGSEILVGDGAGSTFDGGTGNDMIFAGAGNDSIVWNANNSGPTDGRDFVDGGTNTATGDRFTINGSSSAETFRIYAVTAGQNATLAATLGTTFNANTEIVITRTVGATTTVIAELDNIEEISVNALDITANDGGGLNTTGSGDTIQVFGNFTSTSLNFSTITVNGSGGDDTIDISALQSAHRIVFRSNGGHDTIIGNLRPQDVIDVSAIDADTDTNGMQSFVLFAGAAFTSAAQIIMSHQTVDGVDHTILSGNTDEDDEAEFTIDLNGHHDLDASAFNGLSGAGLDDDTDEDDDDVTPPPPATGSIKTGTPQADVLLGTAGDDSIVAFAGDDVAVGYAGVDNISAGEGVDFVNGGEGKDIIFAGTGDDQVFGGSGADTIFGDAGADRLFGEDGEDVVTAGAGDDTVFAGAGNDLILAEINDGNDVYFGEAGSDTLDMSAATTAITVNLGVGPLGNGTATGSQIGSDTLWGIENVTTGSGNDTIIASNAVNVMVGGAGNDVFRFNTTAAADGDKVLGFEPGDRLDFSNIDANLGTSGDQAFTILPGGAFTAAGQLAVTLESRADGDFTVIQGNIDGNLDADFRIEVEGHHTVSNANANL